MTQDAKIKMRSLLIKFWSVLLPLGLIGGGYLGIVGAITVFKGSIASDLKIYPYREINKNAFSNLGKMEWQIEKRPVDLITSYIEFDPGWKYTNLKNTSSDGKYHLTLKAIHDFNASKRFVTLQITRAYTSDNQWNLYINHFEKAYGVAKEEQRFVQSNGVNYLYIIPKGKLSNKLIGIQESKYGYCLFVMECEWYGEEARNVLETEINQIIKDWKIYG